MSRFVDVDAFKEWLLENSINEREVEESKQIGIWIDAFYSMQNEQSDCEDCIKHGDDWECDRVHCHKGDAISRQAAIDAVEFGITYAKAFNKSTGEAKELFKESNKALNEAAERLKELPSVQPRKGKWIRTRTMTHDGELYCDQCEQEHPEQKIIWNFCPNCGSYNGGESDDN